MAIVDGAFMLAAPATTTNSSSRSASNHDVIAKLVPGGVHGLAHLDDRELLKNTRRLAGKSNQLFAALLLHLAAVEARGLHRKRLCASLYTYCIYELRFSEDAHVEQKTRARKAGVVGRSS